MPTAICADRFRHRGERSDAATEGRQAQPYLPPAATPRERFAMTVRPWNGQSK